MIKYADFIEEKPTYRTMINDRGQEVLDLTPRQVHIPELRAPTNLLEYMHALYRKMKEEDNDVETFEDAENFDVPDELGIEMMDTPYEQDFDHIEPDSTAVKSGDAVPAEPEKVTE